MAHPSTQDLRFELPKAAERFEKTKVTGEQMVNEYIAEGMSAEKACKVVEKIIDSQGVVDPQLFIAYMQERLQVSDLLHDFIQEKVKKNQ